MTTPNLDPNTQPPVEEPDVTTAGGGGESPAPESQTTLPQTPPVEIPEEVDEPIKVPSLPGTEPETQAQAIDPEKAWLSQMVQQLGQEVQRLRTEQEQATLSQLPEEEQIKYKLARKEEQLTLEQQQWQEQQARREWYQYYSKWVPEGTQIQGNDPVDWQQFVLTNLYESRERLARENAALKKKLASAPSPAPKISSQTPGPAHRKPASQFTLADIQAIQERALLGHVDPSEYPAIVE